jgi:hypothetical protein
MRRMTTLRCRVVQALLADRVVLQREAAIAE